MDIILTESSYTLFLILLIFGLENKIVITADNLSQLNIEKAYIVKKNKKNKLYYILYLIYLRIVFSKFKSKKYKRVIGSGHLIYSNLLIRDREFLMVEDGLKNYTFVKRNFSDILKSFFGYLNPDAEIKKAKKIYLTKQFQLEKNIGNKVEVIDIENLWKNKTEVERNKILDVYNLDYKFLKKNRDKELLLTQPLSEDGVLSEDEKIELYRKILKNYKLKNIIIKPHPREKTNYNYYFPETYVMDKLAPIELLNLYGLKIKRVITIFSTGILAFKGKAEIDFYGTEVSEKLLKKFGSMEFLIKRNKYL